ncbi:unnamed protein product, partial [Ectocarpus fasciculatus]
PKRSLLRVTISDAMSMEYFFVDDTNGTGTHYSYGSTHIKSMLDGAKKYIEKLDKLWPTERLATVTEASLMGMRVHKNDWIYVALMKNRHLVEGKKVAVVGSSEPRIETIAAAFGASTIHTIEYNKLTYGDGKVIPVRTFSASEFEHFYETSEASFDVVISISSIEHDGLGRYGDPLSPNADLEAMKKVMGILKPGGVFFLSVPIGPDVTVFNLHRRYGQLRLPLLLDGWEVLDKIPWNEQRLFKEANWRQTYEPIFVLAKESN